MPRRTTKDGNQQCGEKDDIHIISWAGSKGDCTGSFDLLVFEFCQASLPVWQAAAYIAMGEALAPYMVF
jgi:hypothetical protein